MIRMLKFPSQGDGFSDRILNCSRIPIKKSFPKRRRKCSYHSMAMGNLNKSKETTPTTTTALKVTLEDHFPQELKSPISDLTS